MSDDLYQTAINHTQNITDEQANMTTFERLF